MGLKLNEKQQKVDILSLGRLRILDEKGEPHYIANFWKENTAVLIFVRHFSCISCRAHVGELWKRKDEFDKSKTKLVFIGQGGPQMLKHFKEDLGVQQALVFTDPTMETFDACGLTRNPLRLMDPRGLFQIQKLKSKGYDHGDDKQDDGNRFQMGGVVALKPPGKVVYHFVSHYVGDEDNPDDWGIVGS